MCLGDSAHRATDADAKRELRALRRIRPEPGLQIRDHAADAGADIRPAGKSHPRGLIYEIVGLSPRSRSSDRFHVDATSHTPSPVNRVAVEA